jgi:hypothetical protein
MEFIYIKRKFLIAGLLFFGLMSLTYSQTKLAGRESRYSISAGMGIIYVNTPVFNDYLKSTIPYSNKDSVRSFTPAFEGFAGLEYRINKKYAVKLDYSYMVRTVTYYYSYYTFEYFYNIHQALVMGYYLINGTHYSFKLGAGAGILFSAMKETNASSTDKVYNSSGPGTRAELIYAADLGKSMEAYFGGNINWYGLGELKDESGKILINPLSGETVKINGFGFGVRLGISIKL